MDWRQKSVSGIALRDMNDMIKDEGIFTTDEHGDLWYYLPYMLNTPEQRRLNAELGISRINYLGNKNGYPKNINT